MPALVITKAAPPQLTRQLGSVTSAWAVDGTEDDKSIKTVRIRMPFPPWKITASMLPPPRNYN